MSSKIRINTHTFRARILRTARVTFVALWFVMVLCAATLVQFRAATAAPASYLNFQARLLTSAGAPVADGYYNVQFNLYSAASGGSSLWTETHYDSNGVTAGNDNRVRIVDGYMSVSLGTLSAFGAIDWGSELFVTMNVGGSTQTATPTWDGEMNPRMRLTAVPYAFAAGSVRSGDTNAASTDSDDVIVGTGDATGATSDSGSIFIDSGTATGTTGSINLGATNASSLVIGNATSTTLLQGDVSVDGGTNYGVFYQDGSGNLVSTLAGSSGNCLVATTGAAPTWGSCTGTGGVLQNGNSFTATMVIGTNDAFNLELETAGITRLTIDQTGDATLTGDLVVQGTADSTFSGNLVVNGNTTIGNASGDTITINSGTATVANDLAITLSGGVNGLNIDSDTLSIDATNNRVGVGTAAPDAQLHINTGSDTSQEFFEIQGATNDLFRIYSDGSTNTVMKSLIDNIQFGGPSWIADSDWVDAKITIEPNSGTQKALVIDAYSGQTADLFQVRDAIGGGNLFVIDADGSIGIGQTTPDAKLEVAGGVSQASWGVNGVQIQASSATFTDTSGAGTVASAVANSFGTPTFASSNARTVTSAATVYIQGNPTAGSNTTITDGYALWIDSGDARFDGNLSVQGNTTLGDASGDTLTFNASTLAIPNNLNIDSNTLFIDSTNNFVNIGSTTSDTSRFKVDTSYTGATAGEQIAVRFAADFGIADTGIKQGLRVATSTSNTSGSVSDLAGGLFLNQNNGNGGNTSNSYGLWVRNDVGAGHTVGTAYGINVFNSSNSGTLTDQFGVRVSNLTSGTNNYGIAVAGASTQVLWLNSVADATTANAGIAFGASRDTNLYRSAANTLMTDDSLTVGTDLTVNGNTTLGNATSDTITFTGRAASTLAPSTTDTYDLGTSALIWNDIYTDRICFDGNTDCATSSAALNTSGFTDDGTVVRLTTATDNVTIGTTTDLSSQLAVDGNADKIQLLVQGNATQTSQLAVFENSVGTDVLRIWNDGSLDVDGGISDISGNLFLNDAVDVAGNLTVDTSTLYVDATANKLGIGTTSIDSTTSLEVALTQQNSNGGSVIDLTGDLTWTAGGDTDVQYGYLMSGQLVPGAATTSRYASYGASTMANIGSARVDAAEIIGFRSYIGNAGASTLDKAIGAELFTRLTGAGNIRDSIGLQVLAPQVTGGGTVTNATGVRIVEQTASTRSANLNIGSTNTSALSQNYSIYNSSTEDNYFGGKLDINRTSGNGNEYSLQVDTTWNSTNNNSLFGAAVNVTRTGATTTDLSTVGQSINVNHSGASSGNVVATGLDISVTGGAGGSSTAVGLEVGASGADSNIGVLIQTASTQTLWVGSTTDPTTANGGIAFGASLDTNLYRSAANTLMTDDSLTVGTNLTVNGNTTLGNATSDTITFTGRAASSLAPTTTDTYDLGTSALIWNDIYTDRICFDGNTDCYTSGAALNLSGFTDDGTVVRLTTATDNVTIGTTTDLSSQLAVDGNADKIQLLVQGNGTQTSNLVVFENSGGADLFTVTNGGNASLAGNLAVDGGTITSSAATLTVNAGGAVDIQDNLTADAVTIDTGNLSLLNTTSSSVGVITKGGSRFIHNYIDPTGGGAVPTGANTFVGIDSGNFTVGSTATLANHGSYNTGLGQGVLSSLTTGYYNTASGYQSLQLNTTGYRNTASGYQSLRNNTIGYQNSGFGVNSLVSNISGYQNVASGYNALFSNTVGFNNSAVGSAALYSNTTGDQNTASGAGALFYNLSGNNSSAIGYNSLYYNYSGSNNTAIGSLSFDTYTDDTGNADTVNSVTNASNTFTVTGHGFTIGEQRAFKVTSTGTVPTGMTSGSIYVFTVTDANTLTSLTDITTDGTGTITITPPVQYSNSTAVGYDAEPTASNQVVLGNLSVTQVVTAADLLVNGTGTSTFAGSVSIQGNTTLGNATSDTITFTGRAASSLAPTTTDTYDLGTSALIWNDIYTDRICFDGNTDCYTSGAALNLSGFTDDGTVVRLTTATDNVTIGTTTDLSSQLAVDGNADKIQLLVQGNGTQTSNLVVFENSGGTDLFTISNTGNVTVSGTYNTNTFTSSALTFGAASAAAISSASAQNLTVDSGTTGAVNIGTGASAKTVTVGSTTGTAITNIQAGTGTAAGDLNLLTTAGGIINIGNNAVANKVLNLGSAGSTNAASTINIATTSANQTQAVTIGSTSSANNVILIQGGTSATAIRLAAGAAGTITVGSQTVANTVSIGTVGSAAFSSTVNIGNSTGAAQTVSIGSTNTTSTTTIAAGSGFLNLNASQVQFSEVTGTRTLTAQTRTTNVAGTSLTVSAGSAGTGASAFTGGTLTLQGGSAGGTGNANGGGVTITGGAGTGTGVQGLVGLAPTAFTSSSTVTLSANGNLNTLLANATNIYSTIPVNATASGYTLTVDLPAVTTVGRVLYISAVNGSSDFTLSLAGTLVSISMKANSTATLIYNGTGWTAAGASSSTDLQAAYNNTLSSAGGAEIVLNNSASANGLTIRNNASSPIIGGILETQTSIGSNLFSVNNNATEYANNGGAESSTFTMWTGAPAGGTVTRYTTPGDNIATGQASVFVDASSTANTGAENTLSTTLTPNLKYAVSYAVRHTSTTIAFNTLDTIYSRDGTNTSTTTCATGSTVTNGIWTRITCTFTAPSSGITSANSIFIRHSDAVDHDWYIDNLSVTVSADVNHAVDGSVDLALGSNWTNFGTLDALTRDTSVIYDTGASVAVDTPNNVDRGVRNNLAIAPATSTQYLVSFYARSSNTFNDIRVRYSRDGGTDFESCVDYSTQTVSTTGFTKITCLFTSDGTTATNADLIIDQPTASNRVFYIDALSVTLNTNNASNVQIGGANKGGPVTLFTLDRASSPPIAANNDAYLGSMYYDTATGRIQCYEADGWGACGSAPDNYVNLNPEYSGAVLNGTGVGTMTADFCANQASVLTVNTGLCASGESRNYYQWTSPQATQQTYSIYVSYQLPSTFKQFASDDTVQLTARVDDVADAAVTYQMFRSESGVVTACGTETTVTTIVDTWQTVGINGNESTSCGFSTSSANAFVIFKINVKADSNANAYVSTLSFTTTGR